jgi:O-antigen/teichoic acid export membrane protein
MARSLRVSTWGGVAVALAVVLFAHPITRVVFGPKLTGAAPLLMVLAWSLPITLAYSHARWALTAAGAQTRVLISLLTGLAVMAVVGPLLSARMGAMGLAIGSIAGGMAVWIAVHVLAARHGSHPPPFSLALRPALMAGAIIGAHLLLAKGALWAAPVGLVLFAAAAPLIDRRLIGDVAKLGGSKLHRGAAA